MACCCGEDIDYIDNEPKSYNGLSASGLPEQSIDDHPYRFQVPAGCVLSETTGEWSRLVVAPGYESMIVQGGPVFRTMVTSNSMIRVEQFDSLNPDHSQKQLWHHADYQQISDVYTELVFAWYNQQLAGWQALLRLNGDSLAFVTTGISESEVIFEGGGGGITSIEVLDCQNSASTVWFDAFELDDLTSGEGTFEIINGDDGTKTPWLYKRYRTGGTVPYYLTVSNVTYSDDAEGTEAHSLGHPGLAIQFQSWDISLGTHLPASYTPGTMLDMTIDGTTYTYETQSGESAFDSVSELAALIPNANIVEYPCGHPRYLVVHFPADTTSDHTGSSVFWGTVYTWPEIDPFALWHVGGFSLDVKSGDTVFGWGYDVNEYPGGELCAIVFTYTVYTFSVSSSGQIHILTNLITDAGPEMNPGFLVGTEIDGFTKAAVRFFGNGSGNAYSYHDDLMNIYDASDAEVDQAFTTIGLLPSINRRYQPNWGVTSTGFVSVGTGASYVYIEDGLTTNHADEEYFHYTLANNRVWASAIVDDSAAPGSQLLKLDVSAAGGADGIDALLGESRLLHEVYRPENEWGDTFSSSNGAYAIYVSSDVVAGVLFQSTIDTYFVRTICKSDCVIECGLEEEEPVGRVWYTTCKSHCICRPQDSPAEISEPNVGRLTVHICSSLPQECEGGGECLYRLAHVESEPGDFVVVTSVETFDELFIGIEGAGPRAWIVNAGGNCECHCVCLDQALSDARDAIIERGGFTNGALIRGRCYDGQPPDCSDDPPPYDCNSAGSTMQLQTSITTACHSWSGNINLSGVAGSGHYEIADFSVADTDCLKLDIEFDCIGGSAAVVAMVIRNADSTCGKSYTRYARHIGPTNVYEVAVSDATNKCCCACSMCGLPAELDWVFNTFFGGMPEATYTGTVDFQTGSESGCTWSVPDPGSAPIPMSVQLTKLGPSSYRLEINAGSGFEGTILYLTECPTGSVTTYDQREEFAMNNVTINFG